MDRALDVFLDNNVVGKADISQEGLYCRVKCVCRLPGSEMYTFSLATEKEALSLGVCVPVPGGFGVNSRFSQKKLTGPIIKAYITPKNRIKEKAYIPLQEGKPFPNIQNLMKCSLQYDGEEIGVAIRDC